VHHCSLMEWLERSGVQFEWHVRWCVQVVPVNSEYLKEHHQLLREFANATLWPKHLLVHYTWKHNNPINTNAGLYLIFILGEALYHCITAHHDSVGGHPKL